MKTNPLATIKKRQTLFRSLTGITQEKFDELVKKTTPLYEQAKEKRLYKAKRERKHGGSVLEINPKLSLGIHNVRPRE